MLDVEAAASVTSLQAVVGIADLGVSTSRSVKQVLRISRRSYRWQAILLIIIYLASIL